VRATEEQANPAPPAADEMGSESRVGAGRRLLTVAIALVITAAGTSLAVYTFRTAEESPSATAPPTGLIAFVNGVRGDVWTVRPDGSQLSQVPLEVPGGVVQVTWSPDGRRLALEVHDQPTVAGRFDIFVVNADGTDLRRLTKDGVSRMPAWSPDGGRIAYVRQEGNASHLFVMRPDGTRPSQLTSGEGFHVSPAWSPDGSRLAFARVSGGDSDIYAVNADGGEEVRLTDDPGWDGDPEWSPDGERIAFIAERPEPGIYSVAPGGTGRTLLVAEEGPGDAQNTHLAWSTDGHSLAFSSPRGPGWARAIYLLDVASGEVRQITERRDSIWGPAWRPIGVPSGSEAAVAQATVGPTIPLGGLPEGIAASGGTLWVAVRNLHEGPPDPRLVRIDTSSSQITATYPLEAPAWYLAAVPGAVWAGVANDEGPTLRRIDPGTGRVVAEFTLGDQAGPIVADEDSAWVFVAESTGPEGAYNVYSLVRIDASTNEVVATIPLEDYVDEMALAEGSVWLMSHRFRPGGSVEHCGPVIRVDAATNELTTIPAGGLNLAAGPGAVWVTCRLERNEFVAHRIDPQTSAYTEPIPLPAGGYGPAAIDETGAWFGGYDPNEIVRVFHVDGETFEVEGSVRLEPGYYTGTAYDPTTRTIWIAHMSEGGSAVRVDVGPR
jgi:Tol biopolymer transport system component